MLKSILQRGVGLFVATQAFEPVRHMRWRLIVHET
jgi:hypothetical protein